MSRKTTSLTQRNFDRFGHYGLNTGPTDEFGDVEQIPADIKNIGWTLGNDCPYRCTHCYSMQARKKGADMSLLMIERIVDQLARNKVETVNLGGNEPIFTNGMDVRKTLLPDIIHQLTDKGIEVGLTTSGITLLKLYENHRDAFHKLNDVDISFDSPFEDEHNKNRGAKIYHQAIQAMEICQKEDKPHSAIMCAMNWNFSLKHIDSLIDLAHSYSANVRINALKPTEPKHMASALTPEQYYTGFARLLERCSPVDLGEPPLAAVTDYQDAKRCPCGRTSFRIHSITPEGQIHVSPCVYMHDYKSPLDLLEHDLIDIINSEQFVVFRQRNARPDMVRGCQGCTMLSGCGGGCAARAFLYNRNLTKEFSMLAKDPYCPKDVRPQDTFPQQPVLDGGQKLVHMDYLCTAIFNPMGKDQGLDK